MKKSQRELLNANLDKALAPPRQKPKQNLDALLDEYNDETAPSKSPILINKPTSTSTPSFTSRTSTPSGTSKASASSITKSGSSGVAPERDFQRVPNSVTRHALPQGVFRGKSKQVWDYLYSVTRGAIIPTRTVRKSRNEIKTGSGLGSMVTVDAAIEHLVSVGLLAVKPAVGSFAGNAYEVFTPEEAVARVSSTASIASTTSLTQNLAQLVIPESSNTRRTQVAETESVSNHANTSFKTKDQTTDDEAFAELNELFKQAVINLTGKSPSASERARWRELAELLIVELQIAAARTGQVSNVPAFLTEHLRRRLWKKDKAQLEREAREATAEPEAKQELDASKCPDCGGSGWWYPDGVERGVAKCKHQSLQVK